MFGAKQAQESHFKFGDQTSEEEKSHQISKFNEIVQLLLSAGYFRARIASLSPFDKVVGGLCWSITASGAAVDVDLFFQENSTIGQRIKLSENIVEACRRIRCPHHIQAHQIHGHDFPAIFPVIQWLVLKVIEWREATGDVVREFSEYKFDLKNTLPQDDYKKSMSFVNMLQHEYRPQRKLRGASPLSSVPEAARVQACLLEYGEKVALQLEKQLHEVDAVTAAAAATAAGAAPPVNAAVAAAAEAVVAAQATGSPAAVAAAQAAHRKATAEAAANASTAAAAANARGITPTAGDETPVRRRSAAVRLAGFDKEYAAAQKAAAQEAEAKLAEAAALESQLLQQMAQVEEGSEGGRVAGRQVAGIVGLQSDAIHEASVQYEAAAARRRHASVVHEGGAGAGAGGSGSGGTAASGRAKAMAHQRRVAALNRQLEEQQQRLEAARAVSAKVSNRAERLAAMSQQVAARNAQFVAAGEKLDGLEAKTEFKDDLSKLKELVALNETLKGQETAFKANCKRQLADLNARLEAAQQQAEGDQGEDAGEWERLLEIERAHGDMSSKHTRLRALLAEKSRGVAVVARAIDDIPTRTELLQYERRFVELYEEVANKLQETRKYFETYNTLDRTRGFLSKEVSLLQSINDGFDANMSTRNKPARRDKFVQQLKTIGDGLQNNLSSLQNQAEGKKAQLEEARQQYQRLVEHQRRYVKAVKDFQEACDLNEQLTERARQLGGAIPTQ